MANTVKLTNESNLKLKANGTLDADKLVLYTDDGEYALKDLLKSFNGLEVKLSCSLNNIEELIVENSESIDE